MFERILVPLEGSPRAEQALRVAAQICLLPPSVMHRIRKRVIQCKLKGKQTMASDMFRIEDGALVLSVSIQPQSSEHTMLVRLGDSAVTLSAVDTTRFLEWANQHGAPIVHMVEQEENVLRSKLLQELEVHAKDQHVWLNIENGCIDLVSHESKPGDAARFQFDLDGMRSALTWLKQREGGNKKPPNVL